VSIHRKKASSPLKKGHGAFLLARIGVSIGMIAFSGIGAPCFLSPDGMETRKTHNQYLGTNTGKQGALLLMLPSQPEFY
jgi:hypothetical protein